MNGGTTTIRRFVSRGCRGSHLNGGRLGKASVFGSRPDVSQVRHPNVSAYLNAIAKLGFLTRERERELGREIRERFNPAAREELIRRNLLLVVNWAAKFQGCGLDLDDLIQEGNCGLIKAAEKYDYRRQVRFTSYASWWIVQSILRALIDKSRTVRVPAGMIEKRNRLRAAMSRFENQTHPRLTLDELSEISGIPKSEVMDIIGYGSATTASIADLSKPDADEDRPASGEALADTKTLVPDAALLAKEELRLASENVIAFLRSLLKAAPKYPTGRYRVIISQRYGLNGSPPQSYAAIARPLHISRERIRQIVSEVWQEFRFRGEKRNESWLLGELNRLAHLECVCGEESSLRQAFPGLAGIIRMTKVVGSNLARVG